MKYIELQEALETELNVINNGLAKPASFDSEYFLNAAVDKFTKTRYSTTNFKRDGFEQTQKRTDDLRTLVSSTLALPATINSKLYSVTIPEDYLMLLGDTAYISPADGVEIPCWEKDSNGDYVLKQTDTLEGTIDTIDRIIENSLSEYHLHYTKARPIRLQVGDEINLYTDGQYKVAKYLMWYLRMPKKIDLHTAPFAEYTDMPEHTHLEIVKIAAQLYLENQANPRYQSYINETSTME